MSKPFGIGGLVDVNAELLAALVAIRDHWACQYDHPKKQGPMYSGPYGIGVTDGHRCAAEIARAAITKAESGS